jgi:hypothetical protein|tara:strand:+ start:67 stop:264 length:198 start_codon:yes stop_codon:yes gene_type:complete
MTKERSLFDKYDFDHDWNDRSILEPTKKKPKGKKKGKTLKLSKGHSDYRKSGMTLSTKDKKKNVT